MKGFRFSIIYQIKHWLEGNMQVYGLVGQTEEGIWPSAALRAICLPQSNQPVCIFFVSLHCNQEQGQIKHV